MSKFSIVMPVYRVEKYIAASIRSICAQTFGDFELILVDDGSPDYSIKIAEEELKGKNVTYTIICQENMGTAVARNKGMALASGEWIICIDSDDCIHSQTLEILASVVEKCPSSVSLVGIDLKMTKDFSGIEKRVPAEPRIAYYSKEEVVKAFLLRKVQLFAPGLLIRRTWYVSNGIQYDEKIRYSEDQHFVWNVLAHAKEICLVDEKLYWYLNRNNSTMTSSDKARIMTGYEAFKRLDEKQQRNEKLWGESQEYIFPRWMLAVLRVVSKYMEFGEFEEVANAFQYKTFMKTLYTFPDVRVKILVRLIMCSKHIFYLIARIV